MQINGIQACKTKINKHFHTKHCKNIHTHDCCSITHCTHVLPYSSAEWGQKITRRKRKKKAVLTSSIMHQPYDDRKRKKKKTKRCTDVLPYASVAWRLAELPTIAPQSGGQRDPRSVERAAGWAVTPAWQAPPPEPQCCPAAPGTSATSLASAAAHTWVNRGEIIMQRGILGWRLECIWWIYVHVRVSVCVHAFVCVFMLYALNFDKYVFVENV